MINRLRIGAVEDQRLKLLHFVHKRVKSRNLMPELDKRVFYQRSDLLDDAFDKFNQINR